MHTSRTPFLVGSPQLRHRSPKNKDSSRAPDSERSKKSFQSTNTLLVSGALTGTASHTLSTYQDKFKQRSLVYFQKLLIPHRDVICSLLFVLIILRRRWIILVVGAPLNHLIMGSIGKFQPNRSPIRPQLELNFISEEIHLFLWINVRILGKHTPIPSIFISKELIPSPGVQQPSEILVLTIL